MHALKIIWQIIEFKLQNQLSFFTNTQKKNCPVLQKSITGQFNCLKLVDNIYF